MRLNKQFSLITWIISALSSSLIVGMNRELTPQPVTNQLPTPGLYQIESEIGSEQPTLIYVSETNLREWGPGIFMGLKHIAGPVETAQEFISAQKPVDPKKFLEVISWLEKQYPSK